jgi:hypothetical protein
MQERLVFVSVALAALSAGCVTEPIATSPTNNAAVEVDLLFEHDGCRVYRFRDMGYHYFARCQGAGPNASVLPDRCGKTGRECGGVPTF